MHLLWKKTKSFSGLKVDFISLLLHNPSSKNSLFIQKSKSKSKKEKQKFI